MRRKATRQRWEAAVRIVESALVGQSQLTSPGAHGARHKVPVLPPSAVAAKRGQQLVRLASSQAELRGALQRVRRRQRLRVRPCGAARQHGQWVKPPNRLGWHPP